MENIPLYNSAVLKIYIDLLEEKYPSIDINQLLEYANIAPYELEDRGHWLTQKQINRFHDFLAKTTENPNIAREAGRFSVQSRSSSILRQYAAAFVTPSVAYWMCGKISATLSKHISIKINYVAANKVVITTTLEKGVNEKPFQCENRIGLFEALAKFFTDEYSRVEHNECIHKGAPYCKYIVSWKTTPGMIWKLIAAYLSVLGIIASLILFFFSSFHSWIEYSLIVALISISSFLISQTLAKKELNKSIESQQNVAEQLMNQFNIRYNELNLIKEIGEAAARILDPSKLLNFITDALQKRLQFNRGMIMLTNQERTKLVYTVGYGYTSEEESLLKNVDFNLTNPQSKGIFYLAYRDKKPFLIDNANDIKNKLSERSSSFITDLGVKAFICVPIIYEEQTEGILAVDNTKSKSQPTQSDLSLLMGIAQQIGISLNNAIAHKKIKESEERFRNLSNNSPDIIYQLDINGKFKYVNPAWEDVLGHNINEIKNKHLSNFIREEDRVVFVEILQNILDDKLTIRDKNFVILNNKSLPRYVTFTGAPDIDAEGNVMGVVGTLKDITRLRIMEAQLLQASKMEAVGTLTGGIAHDFNNIIQAIMGYNQIMISGRTGNETEISYLKSIGELIQRSRELVGQLMLFGKKVEPLSKTININEEIKSMHNLLTKSIPKMIDIQINLHEDVFPLIADSTQIGQIIMNLVINARDAMGDSGKIIISTNNITLRENTSKAGLNIPAGNYIELTVSDTGSGIEKELIQHIFEPFFTTKEAGKGTGLGLAVVHGIVKNHGGFIYCESAPNEGTTFRILFPATTSGETHKINEEKSVKIPRGKEKLLVVDDEKSILETVKETLSSYGYKIITAESAEQALDVYHAQKDKIKLVLLDLNMPGRGGKKCLIDLLAINDKAKVLMTSGYSTSQQIEDLTKAGAAGFINKPYRPEDLLLSVRKILDTSY